MSGKRTPTTAYVEHFHAFFKFGLTTDQIHFRELRFLQRSCIFPVTTGVTHCWVQHFFEQVIARIVVPLTDLESE